MRVTYANTTQDYIAFQRYHVLRDPSSRQAASIVRAMAIVLTAALVSVWFFVRRSFMAVAVSVMLTGALLAFVCFVMSRRGRPQVRTQFYEDQELLLPRTLEVDDGTVMESSGLVQVRYAWSTIFKIGFTADHAFIYRNSFTGIVVSRHSLVGATWDEFTTTLAAFARMHGKPVHGV